MADRIEVLPLLAPLSHITSSVVVIKRIDLRQMFETEASDSIWSTE